MSEYALNQNSLRMTLNHRVPGSSPGAPTTQSSRTGETVIDQKPAVSAGILDAYFQRSRSLSTITASRVDSWPPVSASENSVPGGRVSSGKYRAAALQIRSLGRLESAVSSRGCNYCG